MRDIKAIVEKMTLLEKAQLCSGADFWHTRAVERLDIPGTMVSDGPHGLRKQDQSADHLGINDSIKAVCFPAGCATAASFNRDLLRSMGESLGNACQAEGVSVILGPAMNIKRSPLCGRNFEYYSEDPYLSGEMASALVGGIQSKNVGTSPKHFLANSQEHRRMSSSSEVDERTLREIYMPAFETVVKEQKPWTLMCSYNKINGTYAAESKDFLTDILRDEWGFDGYVVSDWGAVNDRVPDLLAGLDLEMPNSGESTTEEIVNAVEQGKLDPKVLDTACERILNIVYKFTDNRDKTAVFDLEKDHEAARKVAEECVVLLKNDGILPLSEEKKVAVIGKYAKSPRYQGGGSSHINSFKVVSAMDVLEKNANISYAQGFDDRTDIPDEKMLAEAVELAKNAEICVVFAGLPDSFESEGYDRRHLDLPKVQNELIERICAVQKNVVIVLHNGSPVAMPWIDKVNAVVESYLGGQAIGAVQADILYGRVNPSGKLAETFPLKLEDNPSYLSYLGEGNKVYYTEGIFVGYRYYDKKNMDVLFPFGHGLSYTSFAYSDLHLDKSEIGDEDRLTVSLKVKNTGNVAGKEVVQLYIGGKTTENVIRPIKELKNFAKIELLPGEEKSISFTLSHRDFCYWNTEIHDWYAENGEYEILVGASSRDIRLQESIKLTTEVKIPVLYTLDTTIGELEGDERAMAILAPMLAAWDSLVAGDSGTEGAITEEMRKAMVMYMPLRNLGSFGDVKRADIQAAVDKMNALN